MAVNDKKKVQTLINKVGLAVQEIEVAITSMESARATFNSVNPNTAGTALEGNETAVSNWINSARALIDSAVAQGMKNAVVPTHRGESL